MGGRGVPGGWLTGGQGLTVLPQNSGLGPHTAAGGSGRGARAPHGSGSALFAEIGPHFCIYRFTSGCEMHFLLWLCLQSLMFAGSHWNYYYFYLMFHF